MLEGFDSSWRRRFPGTSSDVARGGDLQVNPQIMQTSADEVTDTDCGTFLRLICRREQEHSRLRGYSEIDFPPVVFIIICARESTNSGRTSIATTPRSLFPS